MEDVFIGILIEELKDVKIVNNKDKFNVFYDGKRTGCKLNNLFVAHRVLGEGQDRHLQMAREALTNC